MNIKSGNKDTGVDSYRGLKVASLMFLGMFSGSAALAGGDFAPVEPVAEDPFVKFYADIRYRYEFVDQANLPKDAFASTIRTRVGLKTKSYQGFSVVFELENVEELGDDDFNNTFNGKTDRPVVADVETTEINQFFLKYTGVPSAVIKAGRFVQVLDNQRFVGHVGWRQDNQTFDGVTAETTIIPDTKIFYGYFNQVNRIFGDDRDWDGDIHLVNVKNKSLPIGTITAYGYFLDLDQSAANSSNTVGISLAGKQKIGNVGIKYYAEYASQTDAGDNPNDYRADYYHLKGGIVYSGLAVTVGYEVLGSDDGAFAFRTPLATGHKFNGWADRFLVTPATGLEDFYVDVTYKYKEAGSFFNNLLLKAQYHKFESNTGGLDYGTEFGAYAKLPLPSLHKGLYAELKYADYEAEDFSADTEKVTFGLGFKY